MSSRQSSRQWLAQVVATAAVAAASLAVPATAEAAPLIGCTTQNLVCLFDSGRNFIGAYADVTFRTNRVASAENRFSARTAPRVAYFRHGTGPGAKTSCIEPNRQASTQFNEYESVTAIQIRPGTKCYYGDIPNV